jgi:hypothetical protein
MRDNRFITKLIGLLYIAFLVLFGTNIPVLASQRTDGTVDTKPVSVALAEKDVRLSAGTYATGASELTLVLQPADLPLLEDFDRLQVLDASGSTCYAELIAWGQQHPEVELRYTVELPVVGTVDHLTQEVDLTGLASEDAALAAERLGYLPALRTVELGSPDAGTRVTAADLELLRQSLPNAEIRYTVTLLGQPLDPAAESLDLTALTHEDAESAAAALSGLPNLTQITLAGGEDGLPLEDALLIARAAPKAVVNYPVTLYGKSFNLADEGLDLNHIQVGDQGEQVRQLLPCMRACTWLDMDSCGVDNEHMAVIRDENPNVEVIWRVNFGTNYSVRTNVTKILASMPSKGGTLYDDVGEQLQYCTKVRYLDLGHNEHITNFEFVRNMPDLEICVISMTGIQDLSPFASCQNLIYLEAGNTKINDVSPLAQCPKLRHLNIGTNINITDISPLYDLELKRLWIGSYTPVPREQVEEMQSRHPNCIINTSAPSGLERDAKGSPLNEGYILGWKNYQNYLTADWNYYSAHGAFPAQRPIGWYKVIFKAFEYNKATGAYAFSWNDPMYEKHGAGVKPVNTFVLDTSFLMEDWEDPGSIVPDVLSDPPGEILYESEH